MRPSVVSGSLAAPPSKSATHRALALALLSRRSRISHPLVSEDTLASLAAVEALGAKLVRDGDALLVEGSAIATPPDVLDCENSGTTLRLFSAIAAQQNGHAVLTGDASLRSRPMQPLLDGLRSLGAFAVSSRGDGRAPVIVRGPLRAGVARLPGDVSSQFVSALILASTRSAAGETRIEVTSPLKSRPYVAMTLAALRKFGGQAKESTGAFVVAGDQRLGGADYRVPGDWSSAAFPLVAAAITGGEVTITNLDPGDAQGDRAILPL
ncbi:MAG: 3-phosphoshikimate 1-carboxyvinyltransferase, partial [Thermoplasmatota archaeon]